MSGMVYRIHRARVLRVEDGAGFERGGGWWGKVFDLPEIEGSRAVLDIYSQLGL